MTAGACSAETGKGVSFSGVAEIAEHCAVGCVVHGMAVLRVAPQLCFSGMALRAGLAAHEARWVAELRCLRTRRQVAPILAHQHESENQRGG